jgi:dTDP-4-dehydrorhamnose 3,5-epimerase
VKLSPLALRGAWLVTPVVQEDERGTFARISSQDELARVGIDAAVVQSSVATNKRAGTLRGLHYAARPARETKLVRCVHGRVYDVLLDLRPDEPTFGTWIATELSLENGLSLIVPAGVAHGYLTLEDDSILVYQMSEAHSPALDRGVRFDDPRFGVVWPSAPSVLSARDASFPDVP